MAWHLAGLEVVHGATRRPPEVSDAGRKAAAEAAARVAARCDIRAHRQGDARPRGAPKPNDRTLYVLDVRTPEEYEAGHLARRALGPGRPAGAGNRRAYRHLERPDRAGRRQRRARDDDRLVAEADGLDGRRGAGRRTGVRAIGSAGPHEPRVLGPRRRRSGDRSSRAELRDRMAAGGAVVVDLDTSRRYAPGPHPRRLVRDPLAPAGAPRETSRSRGDRADVAGRPRWRSLAAAELADRHRSP